MTEAYSIEDDPFARAQILSDVNLMEQILSVDRIDEQRDIQAYIRIRNQGKDGENYLDSRSKAQVAVKLGVSTTLLSKVLHGKNVLDIGCGTGTFAEDVTKDKSVHVTALDNDPNILDRVPKRPNITPIEGDGYDLLGSGLEMRSFDAVFVTYSTNFWANSLKDAATSIIEPFKVLVPGGKAYITPIAQNLGLHAAFMQGFLQFPGTELSRPYYKVAAAHSITSHNILSELEEQGFITTAFRTSSKNAEFKKKELRDGSMVSPDSYSAIATLNA